MSDSSNKRRPTRRAVPTDAPINTVSATLLFIATQTMRTEQSPAASRERRVRAALDLASRPKRWRASLDVQPLVLFLQTSGLRYPINIINVN